MNAFEQLCYLYGIGAEFTKYTGETVRFSKETRESALKACNVDFSSEQKISSLNYQLDVKPWKSIVQEVSILNEIDPCLTVRIADVDISFFIQMQIKEFDIALELSLSDGEISGEYIDDSVRYIELQLKLNLTLPIGYHNASIQFKGNYFSTELWVSPDKARSFNDAKQTGLNVQLYTLSSEQNYGIGDFGDLKTLIKSSASSDFDFILLNPLHLLFENEPQRASPYSPSHRGLINPLYISIFECTKQAAFSKINSEHISALEILKQEKQQQFINYQLVSETKYKLLKSLYRHFKHYADAELQRKFRLYCQVNSNLLSCLKDDERAKFWQWVANMQLASCQQLCLQSGMTIGLINDLAVGCAKDGLEYQSNEGMFTQDAEIGAPPDPWAEAGQNWGLPSLDPKKISKDNFAYFKHLIKANMQKFGALRIDHVMNIRRLWWCFKVNESPSGCYVYYPFEHLLAVLKIESHLNNCSLIGEDLGVVPPEVTLALEQSDIYGNTLFYFEKSCSGDFKHGNDYRNSCMLMLSNHDVPPFKAWWNYDDIELKNRLELNENNDINTLKSQRDIEKHRVIEWVNKSNISFNSSAEKVYIELVKTLAQTPPKLFSLNYDDLAFQTFPVNIPGTNTEYSNWRRRVLSPIDAVLSQQKDLLSEINDLRKYND